MEVSNKLTNFAASRTSRAVLTRLANRAEQATVVNTMWKNINFKYNQIMKQNPFYTHYVTIFAQATLITLVDYFNLQIGNRGFNSQRAAFDTALIDELIHRGIDVSSIYDGKTIQFSHPIAMDHTATKVIQQK